MMTFLTTTTATSRPTMMLCEKDCRCKEFFSIVECAYCSTSPLSSSLSFSSSLAVVDDAMSRVCLGPGSHRFYPLTDKERLTSLSLSLLPSLALSLSLPPSGVYLCPFSCPSPLLLHLPCALCLVSVYPSPLTLGPWSYCVIPPPPRLHQLLRNHRATRVPHHLPSSDLFTHTTTTTTTTNSSTTSTTSTTTTLITNRTRAYTNLVFTHLCHSLVRLGHTLPSVD
ncbi:MAG: hypothetical protein JOS17DRAFT_586033 [Linnemannia elongata]|nr:MAG: hypothetical protein JOS17DRAFT_586033 [Linnemannia elongata]